MEVEFYRGRRASFQYLNDTHDILDRMGYVVALHARERERERERERKRASKREKKSTFGRSHVLQIQNWLKKPFFREMITRD
mmetsp:Transcript_55612/g.81742  ORF Transcript_55612/g.81742 Transcript_55612/m.81742 type:complete len:82 (-) Transcript_55612:911-1156(-)